MNIIYMVNYASKRCPRLVSKIIARSYKTSRTSTVTNVFVLSFVPSFNLLLPVC
ncbi:hypothetical protein LP026_009 [Listeria phage LP-026]|uniref:Uncharacterized protein n=1 Tax=Listeria phage LP-026 TaxID=1173745 RepID=A0A059TAJ9_9CAUD|nr:hypothetical protein LP026_009 [Listeria phage LP-026]AHN84703.1 hypothetical protein LP026_009 [Listeria phage LP-026]